MAAKRFLLPMARNTVTGETVKTQNLGGEHFNRTQEPLAKMVAKKLAEDMTARSGQEWVGFLREYNPGENLPK
jgi:acetyl-CoA carboxylase carboxyltransferase component